MVTRQWRRCGCVHKAYLASSRRRGGSRAAARKNGDFESGDFCYLIMTYQILNPLLRGCLFGGCRAALKKSLDDVHATAGKQAVSLLGLLGSLLALVNDREAAAVARLAQLSMPSAIGSNGSAANGLGLFLVLGLPAKEKNRSALIR